MTLSRRLAPATNADTCACVRPASRVGPGCSAFLDPRRYIARMGGCSTMPSWAISLARLADDPERRPNKLEPGKLISNGARSKPPADGRQIHFQGAGKRYLAYHCRYGRGNVFQRAAGHVGVMAPRYWPAGDLGAESRASVPTPFHDVAVKEGAPIASGMACCRVTTSSSGTTIRQGRPDGGIRQLGEIAGVCNIEVLLKARQPSCPRSTIWRPCC